MSKATQTASNSLAVFFAHSRALETEAAQRHLELADVMDVHNNEEAAAVFRKLAGYGEQHAAQVSEMMRDVEPVRIAPWDFDWGGGEAPETSAMEHADYRMSAAHALQMALRTEQSAHDYYAQVAASAEDDDVRRYAEAFAAEEAEHVRYVREWIAKHPGALDELPRDDDPAHMPE